jgi:hypothetical protein
MSQRKPGRNIFVWIMMGLLIIGLGGFGIGNFGGGAGAVGSVGTVEISVDDYARAFDDVRRAEMQRLGAPLSVPQALEAGLGAQALGSLVTAAALEHETARLGISVGDAALQQVLRGAALFQGPTGAFDPNLFDAWLDNRNMSAPDFLADLRADIARGLLLDAVAGGVRLNPAHADALLGMMANQLVYARLAADLDTPVSVMLKLPGGRAMLHPGIGHRRRGARALFDHRHEARPDLANAGARAAEINRTARYDRDAFEALPRPAAGGLRALSPSPPSTCPPTCPPPPPGFRLSRL